MTSACLLGLAHLSCAGSDEGMGGVDTVNSGGGDLDERSVDGGSDGGSSSGGNTANGETNSSGGGSSGGDTAKEDPQASGGDASTGSGGSDTGGEASDPATGDGDGGIVPPPTPSFGKLVLDVDFDSRSGSMTNYTYDKASSDFGGLDRRSSGEVRGFDGNGKSWPANNTAGNGYLRANFPPNTAGGPNCGFLFDKQFEGVDEATLQYRVYFEGAGPDDEFVWAAGGKLPGLGGTNKSGGIPVGCTKNESNIQNGWSARFMWRRNGRLVVYTYFPERTSNCGEDFSFFTDAQPNQWYTIRQHIKLNTPGQRDGLLEMFVDGERTLHLTDVLYRLAGKGNVDIDNVLFHTYRGGKPDDTRFHSPNDDHVRFDDFKVWVNE